MVVLLPLPEVARKVLIEHDAEILCIFEGYAFAFATKSAGGWALTTSFLSARYSTVEPISTHLPNFGNT